jgi:transposase InsO family protein
VKQSTNDRAAGSLHGSPPPSSGVRQCYRTSAVEFATLEWVDWFNNRRLLEPIGNIPPAEAEERYYAMLNEPAMAA